MSEVRHLDDDCTGSWRLERGGGVVRCNACGAEWEATPEHRHEAIEENYAGIYLRRLTTEGQRKL